MGCRPRLVLHYVAKKVIYTRSGDVFVYAGTFIGISLFWVALSAYFVTDIVVGFMVRKDVSYARNVEPLFEPLCKGYIYFSLVHIYKFCAHEVAVGD